MNTAERITELLPNEVFVFGSNYAGRHCADAALDALKKFGAISGKNFLQGRSYGIPTKGHHLEVLSLLAIEVGVDHFTDCAAINPQLRFLVTPIGCGLAGYKPSDIAPMFREAMQCGNVILPKVFTDILMP